MNTVKYLLIAACVATGLSAEDAIALRAPPASSSNLLKNPEFSNGLSGWVVQPGGSVSWVTNFGFNPDDQIGSVAIIASSPPTAISQCVPVSNGGKYAFSTNFVQYCEGAAMAIIQPGSLNCQDAVGEPIEFALDKVVDGWLGLREDVEIPAAARSIEVSLVNTAACDDVVFFDDVVLSDAIFSDSFGL